MKKILLFIIFLCAICQIHAQSQQIKVTLKSGVVLTGDLKELNPTEYVIIILAGKESKILMNDVESIDNIYQEKEVDTPKATNQTLIPNGQVGYYEILDENDYPEEFIVSFEGHDIKMILIRGGSFNMGYNGSGSLGMKSEPVHQVNLSSFYISEQPISYSIASYLLGIKDKSKKQPFYYGNWNHAYDLVSMIAKSSQKPFRLITEAEWEYVSLMPIGNNILGSIKACEWCYDFFAKYVSGIQTNPIGPEKGNSHVARSYHLGKNKYDRKPFDGGHPNSCLVRLAISADAIR